MLGHIVSLFFFGGGGGGRIEESQNGKKLTLVHEGNVSVATSTRLLELLLALLGGLAIPVFTVNIRRDDAIAQVAHGWQHIATRSEVRGSHVCGLDANDVDEGLLKTCHLAGQVV